MLHSQSLIKERFFSEKGISNKIIRIFVKSTPIPIDSANYWTRNCCKKSEHIFYLKLFEIKFTDSPVCAESTVSVVGASLDESITVPCRVNADPPDVEFEWSFSSSGERYEVPAGHYTTMQDISVGGADGSRSGSMLYDSEEAHGDNEGESLLCLHFNLFFISKLKSWHFHRRSFHLSCNKPLIHWHLFFSINSFNW